MSMKSNRCWKKIHIIPTEKFKNWITYVMNLSLTSYVDLTNYLNFLWAYRVKKCKELNHPRICLKIKHISQNYSFSWQYETMCKFYYSTISRTGVCKVCSAELKSSSEKLEGLREIFRNTVPQKPNTKADWMLGMIWDCKCRQ